MESEGPQKSWIDRIPRVESRAAGISLAVSVGLLVVKFVAFFLTGSAAIFSDAVESIANVMGASVALFALGVAHSPADEEHPYGHGKVEFLSAMFEGSLVLLAAVFILFRTVDVMSHGELVREGQLELGLWLTGLALAINGGVGFYLIRTGRKQGSMTLEADGKHLMSDALTSIAVLVGLALVKLTGWSYFDPITAILIGLFIGGMAINLLRGSAAKLMDTQDPEDMQTLDRDPGRPRGSRGDRAPHLRVSQAASSPQRTFPLGRLPPHGARRLDDPARSRRGRGDRRRDRTDPGTRRRDRPRRALRQGGLPTMPRALASLSTVH